MNKEFQIIESVDLQDIEGGVGLAAFAVAVLCSAVVGVAFGYGAHIGMEETKAAHGK